MLGRERRLPGARAHGVADEEPVDDGDHLAADAEDVFRHRVVLGALLDEKPTGGSVTRRPTLFRVSDSEVGERDSVAKHGLDPILVCAGGGLAAVRVSGDVDVVRPRRR
jgi:hypothetical protein